MVDQDMQLTNVSLPPKKLFLSRRVEDEVVCDYCQKWMREEHTSVACVGNVENYFQMDAPGSNFEFNDNGDDSKYLVEDDGHKLQDKMDDKNWQDDCGSYDSMGRYNFSFGYHANKEEEKEDGCEGPPRLRLKLANMVRAYSGKQLTQTTHTNADGTIGGRVETPRMKRSLTLMDMTPSIVQLIGEYAIDYPQSWTGEHEYKDEIADHELDLHEDWHRARFIYDKVEKMQACIKTKARTEEAMKVIDAKDWSRAYIFIVLDGLLNYVLQNDVICRDDKGNEQAFMPGQISNMSQRYVYLLSEETAKAWRNKYDEIKQANPKSMGIGLFNVPFADVYSSLEYTSQCRFVVTPYGRVEMLPASSLSFRPGYNYGYQYGGEPDMQERMIEVAERDSITYEHLNEYRSDEDSEESVPDIDTIATVLSVDDEIEIENVELVEHHTMFGSEPLLNSVSDYFEVMSEEGSRPKSVIWKKACDIEMENNLAWEERSDGAQL